MRTNELITSYLDGRSSSVELLLSSDHDASMSAPASAEASERTLEALRHAKGRQAQCRQVEIHCRTNEPVLDKLCILN